MDLRYRKVKVNCVDDIEKIAEKLKAHGYKWAFPLPQFGEDLTKVEWMYITFYGFFHHKMRFHRRRYYTEIDINEL